MLRRPLLLSLSVRLSSSVGGSQPGNAGPASPLSSISSTAKFTWQRVLTFARRSVFHGVGIAMVLVLSAALFSPFMWRRARPVVMNESAEVVTEVETLARDVALRVISDPATQTELSTWGQKLAWHVITTASFGNMVGPWALDLVSEDKVTTPASQLAERVAMRVVANEETGQLAGDVLRKALASPEVAAKIRSIAPTVLGHVWRSHGHAPPISMDDEPV